MDVMGEVKPECLPEWAKEKAQELIHKKLDNQAHIRNSDTRNFQNALHIKLLQFLFGIAACVKQFRQKLCFLLKSEFFLHCFVLLIVLCLCFGASANSRGSAVFCTNLHTGKSTRYERMDVMGEVKPERLPEWAKEKAQELSNKKRNKDKER